jgi:ribosomal protein S18 acetylase RimI-like enzyme
MARKIFVRRITGLLQQRILAKQIGIRFKADYPLCSSEMKLPPFVVAPLALPGGVPSAALRRAAEAWPANQRDEQLATVLQTAGRSPPRFVLLATESTDRTALPTAAVLAECLPGRAAVVMTPQIETALISEERTQLAKDILLALDQALLAEHMLLAQALTQTRADEATPWFLAADYRLAGDMLYLGAELNQAEKRRIPGIPIEQLELQAHSPADVARWVPLIDQTYVNTLDCPAVDGLRPTSDVLLGYRDIGRPRDDWWFIASHAGKDVGCLLLADHHPASHAELVYMGLIPEARGRGWGVHLALQAQKIAATSGAEYLVLSVDAANMPALRHYQAAGFHFWEQRSIVVKAIR